MLRDLSYRMQNPKESEALDNERFKKLMERAKELDVEQARLLAELNLTPEEIEDIVENRKLFTPLQWEEILAYFEEALPEWEAQSAAEIRKTRQSLSEIQRNWLYVR